MLVNHSPASTSLNNCELHAYDKGFKCILFLTNAFYF